MSKKVLQLICAAMSAEVLCDILNTVRKHLNISVKVEITSKNNVSMTKIILKESILPSWNKFEIPEVKKRGKKKTPSKLRRDAKRREVYLAKKAGTTASVTTGHILPSLPTPEETQSYPRRTANPNRRLEQRNGDGEGDEGMGEDLTGERRNMSPIPQLDGGGGESYDKDDN